MKNNLPTEGYGKLFINGEYVSRIYSQYHFIKILPVGVNEIKVILSTNLDHDIPHQPDAPLSRGGDRLHIEENYCP